MRYNHLTISILLFVFSIFLSTAGGIFFGLFSCGGYRWHSQAFTVAFSLSLLVLFIFPRAKPKDTIKRAIIAVGIVFFFFVVRAGASAFYPAVPASWGDFFNGFCRGLLYGPC